MKLLCILLVVSVAVVHAQDSSYQQSVPASAPIGQSTQQIYSPQLPTDISTNDGQHQGSQVYQTYPKNAYYPEEMQIYKPQNVIYPVAEEKYPDGVEQSGDAQPYANTQVLDNPAYDPQLYQTFVPQDAVQQYVSSYGGPYPPASSAVGYPVGASAAGAVVAADGAPPPGGFPPDAFAAGGFPPGGFGPDGFGPGGFPPGGFPPGGFGPGVFTGYEGFLVPGLGSPVPPIPPPSPYGVLDVVSSIIPNPRTLATLFMRSGSMLMNMFWTLLFGGAATAAICTFTPVCTISFAALPLLGLRGTAQKIGEKIGTEVTKERMARAVEFVRTALEKYQQMQMDYMKPKLNEEIKSKETPRKKNAK